MSSTQQQKPNNSTLYEAYLELLQTDHLWQSDSHQALSLIVQQCASAMGVDRVGIWVLNPENNLFQCQVFGDAEQCQQAPELKVQRSAHPKYFAEIEQARVLAVENTFTHPITHSFIESYLLPENVHAILDASVLREGKVIGALSVEHTRTPRKWSDAEKNYVSALADIVSQVLAVSSLCEKQERYQKMFNATSDAVLLMRNKQLVDCNEATLEMFGCTREQYFSQPAMHFWAETQISGEPSRELAIHYFERSIKSARMLRFEWRHRKWNGIEFDTEVDLNRVNIQGKEHFVVAIRNISERKAFERHIHDLLTLQQAVFNGAAYSIISTDEHGKILSFNRTSETLLGYTAHQVIRKASPTKFLKQSELTAKAKRLNLPILIDQPYDFEVLASLAEQRIDSEWTFVSQQGKETPIQMTITPLMEQQALTGYLIFAIDISERKETLEALQKSRHEMEYRTMHDTLTGLPNRTRLHEEAQSAIEAANINNYQLALLLVDLDHFKEVNDTLGHSTGDEVLKHIGERLNTQMKKYSARLYRLGGDEFAILLPEVDKVSGVDTLAAVLQQTLKEAISINNIHVEMEGSIGIALYPKHGDNSHSLLRCADVAMYKAKKSSASSMHYQPQSDSHSPRRLAMMAEIGHAIRNDQLILHYQPRVAINNQHCLGCEALVRWQHPTMGMIPPNDFIPLAELSNQITALGYWVMRTALKQAKQWMDEGINQVVSVNLSTHSLIDITFPERLRLMLHESGVPPNLLEIEITESTLIDDPERTLQIIDRIHNMGVRFAIDDFGTGYSSLSYLKRLPIDTLKIDQSFIKDMLTDEQDAVIVKSTLNLAHDFGLTVVAEGVEDEPTLTALKNLDCEQVQGYFYSKPLPPKEFKQWLTEFSAVD